MATKEERKEAAENEALRQREDEVGQEARREYEEQRAEEQADAAAKSPQVKEAESIGG